MYESVGHLSLARSPFEFCKRQRSSLGAPIRAYFGLSTPTGIEQHESFSYRCLIVTRSSYALAQSRQDGSAINRRASS